jgi:hypothetical protein
MSQHVTSLRQRLHELREQQIKDTIFRPLSDLFTSSYTGSESHQISTELPSAAHTYREKRKSWKDEPLVESRG